MAFCNACGNSLEAGAKFCPKCGAQQAASAGAAPAAPAGATPAGVPPPPAQGSSGVKIILIVVAVIVGLGILGVGTMAFFVHRVISRSHIETKNGNVKIDSPFGTVESTQDPTQAAQNVGVDVYPGATLVKGAAADFTFGSVHSSAAEFETDDPPATVAAFYKAKFPAGNFIAQGDRYSILSGTKGNMTTITVQPENGKTRIHVTKVTTPSESAN